MTDATARNSISPLDQLLAFADWEDKYNPVPGGGTHIARWAYDEIIRFIDSAPAAPGEGRGG